MEMCIKVENADVVSSITGGSSWCFSFSSLLNLRQIWGDLFYFVIST